MVELSIGQSCVACLSVDAILFYKSGKQQAHLQAVLKCSEIKLTLDVNDNQIITERLSEQKQTQNG